MTNNSNRAKERTVRPFLKWIGGKGQLINSMSPYFPKNFNVFYEPFAGGGAVFFSLLPEVANLNDINTRLITTYKVIKKNPRMLIDALKAIESEYIPLGYDERKQFYLKKRDLINTSGSSDIEVATLMIFLNKTCFNGMYRVNSAGDFNVPFGKYANPKICDSENITQVSNALKGVGLTSLSYAKAVKNAQKGDFIYLDPPYDPLSQTSSFTSYSKDSFTKEDQIKLRDLFIELDRRGCYVMLSNSATDFIKEIYKGYDLHIVKARRSINAKADGRGEVDEAIVTNYKVENV